ncbi:GTP-binding protein HflX [Scardovia wiggsiae F0424]|uniref:GTPase HflX n=1 Tax=Scardovia wiggsiae F0424 TaxID=857290 RepID=J0D3T7_9BIFI|nr:GTPase HflX [Scardovia wiggsiae]EJD64595.1 GTP-binding protein HflX [Scardovia wiggsiae F0424]
MTENRNRQLNKSKASYKSTRKAGRRNTDLGSVLDSQSEILLNSAHAGSRSNGAIARQQDDEGWKEREGRNELKRVTGLGELEDVTEVEYRRIRLERVVLVGVWSSRETTQAQAEESLRELAALARTAGAQVMEGVLQHRFKPDPATYVGKGKANEIAAIVAATDSDTIIVDADLPPSQRRALEDVAKVKVVDRTAVILDIFAQHATSREGKAQVELAQLEYMLPRLRGWGAALSRQAGGQSAGANGGIGSRGPGETQIELDRRVIRTRMARLRRQIARMAPARDIKRGSRRRNSLPTVAVVGYTNAGKSSLINRLTRSHELVENALFATLDTAVRHSEAANGRRFMYVDTVGFVRQLPTQLIEAFKSTLEEAAGASVIIHVVDASHPNPFSQIDAVNDVLQDIPGIEGTPALIVFNKIDCIDEAALQRLKNLVPDAFFISALTEEGIDALRKAVESRLPQPGVHVDAVIPYTRGDLVSRARQFGSVGQVEYGDTGIHLTADVDSRLAAHIVASAEVAASANGASHDTAGISSADHSVSGFAG